MVKEFSKTLPSLDAHNAWLDIFERNEEYPATLFVVPSADIMHNIHCIVKRAFDIRNVHLNALTVRDSALEEIKKNLASSFLGQKLFYWVRELETVSKNTQMSFFHYLMSYKGPHVIMMAAVVDSPIALAWKGHTIVLPVRVSKRAMLSLCAVWYKQDGLYKNIEHFFGNHDQMWFTSFARIFPYIPFLGRSLAREFEIKYLPRLISSDPLSLFSFMDLFWQRNIQSFYNEWSKLRFLYGNQFWITFWSEQLFRAYYYAYSMKGGAEVQAQQLAARKLTFFYTKIGWKVVNFTLLKELHEYIYALDYHSKNGATGDMIESVYLRWFNQKK